VGLFIGQKGPTAVRLTRKSLVGICVRSLALPLATKHVYTGRMSAEEAGASAAEPKPSSGSKLPLIAALLNTLVILATAGLIYYTRNIFKRPKITETQERQRIQEARAKKLAPTVPALIKFDPMTINIAPGTPRAQITNNDSSAAEDSQKETNAGASPQDALPPAGGETTLKRSEGKSKGDGRAGRTHYLSISFSLEIRDEKKKDAVEAVKPLFFDRLLSLLGKKNAAELNTVQGRYLLRTEILNLMNTLIAKGSQASLTTEDAEEGSNKRATEVPAGDGLVTHVYFTQFVVQ
jgi:flagellar basal body-associated protein FliL